MLRLHHNPKLPDRDRLEPKRGSEIAIRGRRPVPSSSTGADIEKHRFVAKTLYGAFDHPGATSITRGWVENIALLIEVQEIRL